MLLAKHEKTTKITVEDVDFIYPTINICPSYNAEYNDSIIISIKDNYTLKDIEHLPSLLTILKPKILLYEGYELVE